jgi:hypothetical protein
MALKITDVSERAAVQPDDAVVVALAAVDDAGPPGVLAQEQEEVVPDQLHLQQRLVDRHRLAGVLLLPHDLPGRMTGEGVAVHVDVGLGVEG